MNKCRRQGPERERTPDAATIKAAAAGRWLEVLAAAGIPAELLDGKGHPCPRCGGTDRFAAFKDVADRGAVLCRRCFSEGGGDGLATVAWIRGVDFPAAVRWLADYLRLDAPHPAPGSNGKRRIVATYDYRDAAGGLLFQVLRYDPKGFSQRRPDPDKAGGWLSELGDVPRVLYRLPELLAADPTRTVFFVEGEKDADRLAKLGLTTSTAPGAWRDAYAQPLQGRPVIVLPDNDEPGRKHAQRVARSLATVAALVKVLHLPDLPDKGDVSDWLDAGGTAERLQELADAAPVWTPGTDPAPDDRPASVRLFDRGSELPQKTIDWLWRGRIPMGELTLIVADPGTGKSTVAADIAARVTAGLRWPDSGQPNPAGDVVVLSLEESRESIIIPRLAEAGGDIGRLVLPREVYSLEKDLMRLDQVLLRTEPRLLVIDTISAYLGEADGNRMNEVWRLLGPLIEMARRRHVALLVTYHLNKSTDKKALYRISGSVAFTAASRAVWFVLRDIEDERRGLFLLGKKSLPEMAPGLAYRIDRLDAGPFGRVAWEAEPFAKTADEYMGRMTPDEARESPRVADAKEWLLEFLQGEPIGWDEVIKQAGREHEKTTLRRARDELRKDNVIKCEKRGNGRGAKWLWHLTAHSLPLFAGLDDDDAPDDTAAELVELARSPKPR